VATPNVGNLDAIRKALERADSLTAISLEFACGKRVKGGANENGEAGPLHQGAGQGCQSPCLTDQLGRWTTAPLRPHCEHRAQARSLSLEASRPQRIISGVIAVGAMWPQPCASQHTQTHGVSLRTSARVGTVVIPRM
jgi:hypothetical protein